jgi:hypothetical protein
MNLLLLLLAGHAVCDYPLQGDFLARGKNHMDPIPGIPWWQCLAAHSMIHAGMVTLLTDWHFGVMEFALHFLIDHNKCRGKFGFNTDQALHVGCKLLWFWLYTHL